MAKFNFYSNLVQQIQMCWFSVFYSSGTLMIGWLLKK
jgi:hypothetical protein